MRRIICGGGGGSGDGAYSFCRDDYDDDDASSRVIYGGVTDCASFFRHPVG